MGVFDNTADAVVSIWGTQLLNSIEPWSPSQTILLITNARCSIGRRAYISITAASFIDVNPIFEDAEWLRNYIKGITRRQHANPQFPEGGPYPKMLDERLLTRTVFDLDQWLRSDMKALFLLSDVDDL